MHLQEKYNVAWKPVIMVDNGKSNVTAMMDLVTEKTIADWSLCKFHYIRAWWTNVVRFGYSNEEQADLMGNLHVLAVQKEERHFQVVHAGLKKQYPDFFNNYFDLHWIPLKKPLEFIVQEELLFLL